MALARVRFLSIREQQRAEKIIKTAQKRAEKAGAKELKQTFRRKARPEETLEQAYVPAVGGDVGSDTADAGPRRS